MNLLNCRFCIPPDQRVKLKERETINKYTNPGRETENLCNMKVTLLLIRIGANGTNTKQVVKALEDAEIRGPVETIKTAVFLKLAGILRRLHETCCHANYSEIPSAKAGVKKLSKNKIIIRNVI